MPENKNGGSMIDERKMSIAHRLFKRPDGTRKRAGLINPAMNRWATFDGRSATGQSARCARGAPYCTFGCLVLAALLIVAVPASADDVKAKPAAKADSSLDDELLKQLDDDLEGRSPAKHGHKHDHDAHAEETPAAPEKPAAPETAKKSDRPAQVSTDEDLLKELDAEDEPSIGPSKSQPGDDLGEAADPLTRIGSKMRHAVTLIDREKLSAETTALQDEIVKDIDELIKQQKKKMQQQQQQSSSQQQKDQQQSSRSNVKPQGKQAQQQRPQQNQGGGEQQSKQAAKESSDEVRKNEQKEVKLDPAAQDELLKRVWGLLPEKDREQMRQAAGDQFLPEYESLIIRYFRRLAEEEDSQR
jgi:hypothetical protein